MILSKEYLKNRSNEVSENYFNYLLLDVEHLNENTKQLKRAIEVLNVINNIQIANNMYKDFESLVRIDCSIYFEILKSIYNEKHFTDDQLIQYYETGEKLTKFWHTISTLRDIETILPISVDLMLLGLDLKTHDSLSDKQKMKIHDKYSDAVYVTERSNSDLKEFVKDLKFMINEFKGKISLKSA